MPLKPDSKENINGLVVYKYNLLQHNPNSIELPESPRRQTKAITIHNTESIIVASNTTPAEQYVRATLNGNMNDCRVNYYVDDYCAWQCLPDEWVNWSCADGCRNPNSGNNTSVAIEIIGKSEKAENNGIKLAAYLIKKFGLTVAEGLRTHSYWMNVRDGRTGTIDELNVMRRNDKNCPVYILPHWNNFKDKVLKKVESSAYNTQKGNLYRVRKTWSDVKSQRGAFLFLENAIESCPAGYSVYDQEGKVVFPISENSSSEKIKTINIFYRSYVNGRWLGEIVNYENNTPKGFSGITGKGVSGFSAKTAEGILFYKAHVKGGGWLNWISEYNPNDWSKGCAGFKSQQIDALQMYLYGVEGYEVKYRVSPKGQDYYPWIVGAQDYAGAFGKVIDRIQAEIIKI